MSESGQSLLPSPAQIKAARALCGLSQEELASLTGKTTKTIRRAETEQSRVARHTVQQIRRALEAAGIEFIPENGGGPGVRLKK